MKILVADDEKVVLDIYRQILEEFGGFTVVAATSAEEALSLVDPDVGLAVTDLCMPGIGGIGFIRSLRNQPSSLSLPILAVSGDPSSQALALDAGATQFLPKPVSGRGLVSAVKALLGCRDGAAA